ncbi:MAG: site-specific integrase [Rhodobacteraceae bacterium]|nr:site-specific integrase [Paracoccaceae bacterium]
MAKRASTKADQEEQIPPADFRFMTSEDIVVLPYRDSPFWYSLATSRHIGIHRPDDRICNWTARILTKNKRYVQKCLGPAIDLGRGVIDRDEALRRAHEWFGTGAIRGIANEAKPNGRAQGLRFSPFGSTYSVGHALRDYVDWTRVARSSGGHYNNLTLINHHLSYELVHLPLEDFNARHLKSLAQRVIETPPKHGFSKLRPNVTIDDLGPDDLRRRKRTFNSLVTILRMAFQNAWDNGSISSERPWRCIKRISVNHSPRTIFLTREECSRLLKECTPALRILVLAGLYTGCRVGELGELRAEDVGHQIFGIRVAAFKRSPARFVFLPDEGMAFFLSCCEGKTGRDHVLHSDLGKVWRKQHTALFRRAVARARLPSEFVFHGLRHTYASDLVRQGVPLEVIAQQLGHADVKTVSSTYGHLSEQFREELIRTRFSPLSAEQQLEANHRERQLDDLWQSFRRRDWRDYAVKQVSSGPLRQSYVRTSKEVLEAFRVTETH